MVSVARSFDAPIKLLFPRAVDQASAEVQPHFPLHPAFIKDSQFPEITNCAVLKSPCFLTRCRRLQCWAWATL